MNRGLIPMAHGQATCRGQAYRGQVATEFFIYAGVFLILVIAVAVALQFTQSNEIGYFEYSVSKENGQSFPDAVHLALKGGQGFTYVLNFPQRVLGYPYTIYFDGNGDSGRIFMTWFGPRGNFTQVYPTEPFYAEYKICEASGSELKSDVGENKLNITNDGSKLLIIQKC